jgi:hypothetical protein
VSLWYQALKSLFSVYLVMMSVVLVQSLIQWIGGLELHRMFNICLCCSDPKITVVLLVSYKYKQREYLLSKESLVLAIEGIQKLSE